MSFPKDFIWGAATAAYQVEGAAYEDGRGLSVWDVFCRKPGAVWGGHTGEVACDHYHRYPEDIRLMKDLGVRAYRLSFAWPRILPEGTGRVNPKGLGFYDKLIDGLLEAGITPYVTLFHWDYPYSLFCRGGWLNSDCPEWFAEYTEVVVKHFSDRVEHWMTLNEPNGFVWAGYQLGFHAPGLAMGPLELFRVIHNVLRCHGRAVQVIRSLAPSGTTADFVLSAENVIIPLSASEKDVEAARTAMFSVENAKSKGTVNIGETWWLDPVYRGRYPEDGLRVFEPYLPDIKPEDLKIIHQPLDHFCVNIYKGNKYHTNARGESEPVPAAIGAPMIYANNNGAWALMPETMYWGVKFYYERYKKPILITENGMPSAAEWIAVDGQVHDAPRVDFLTRYLAQLKKACAHGVDVRGYFHWSIMDNFEWSAGYRERCGIVYVDYQTQKRTPKDSASVYKKIIAANGKEL